MNGREIVLLTFSSIVFNKRRYGKLFVRNGRCLFCARSDPGIFVPFFMGFRG